MKTTVPIRDETLVHRGFRSPAYKVLGEYGHGIHPALVGMCRHHDQALAMAKKQAHRGHFREIVIQ